MRLLMIAPYGCDPPRNGGMVRVTNIRRGLANHFDITYVAPAGAAEPSDVHRVVTVRSSPRFLPRIRSVLSRQAYHARLWANPFMTEAVRRELLAGSFDAVYCHLIYSVDHIPDECRLPIVVDQQNIDSDYWRSRELHGGGLMRFVARLNRKKVVALEGRIYKRADAVVCVSSTDRDQMRALGVSESKLIVAPNGADVRPLQARRVNSEETVLGFLGSFDMAFNRVAAGRLVDSILPEVRLLAPSRRVRVLLIGRGSDLWLKRRPRPDVAATGEVDDPRRYLEDVDIFVAPLSDGAGTKLKVIEALAAGIPVVGSALALRGLGGRSGEHFVQAGEHSFGQEIVDLIADPAKANRLARAGHAFAREHFDWSSVIVPILAAELQTRIRSMRAEPAAN